MFVVLISGAKVQRNYELRMKNNELFCARTAFLRLKNQKSQLSSNICNPQLTKDSLMVLHDDAQRCRHAVFCAVGDIPFYEGFVHKKYT